MKKNNPSLPLIQKIYFLIKKQKLNKNKKLH